MTAPAYSALTITDALPDGRPFEIRYLSVTDDAPAASLLADALDPAERTERRKAGYMERLGLSPDAPPRYVTTWHASSHPSPCPDGTPDPERPGDCQHPDGRAWLAHWRDELARLNGTSSETAKAIIRDALDGWDSPAALARFVWVLA